MSQVCRGVTVRGKKCQLKVKNGHYCRFHVSQGREVPEIYAPVSETAYKASPNIRRLSEKQETLTSIPNIEEEGEGEEPNIGVFEGEIFPDKEEDIGEIEKEHPHECCICLDVDVRKEELLDCNHAVCITCLEELRKAECPVCRRNLSGITVTDEIVSLAAEREEQDIADKETEQLLISFALEQNPNIDPTTLYNRFYHIT